MVKLKTKNCPFCGKEISDEAIICKFCHRLLIDENGNDIKPGTDEEKPQHSPEPEEDKTIIYNKEELQKALGKNAAARNSDPEPEPEYIDDADEIEPEDEDMEDAPVIDDDIEDEEEETSAQNDEEYNKSFVYTEEDAANDYDPKRTFMITAIITIGILLIIIVAVLVGYKLFGLGGDGDSSSEPVSSTAPAATTASLADGADMTTTSFVPQVTNDTLSDNPEETLNSAISDPAVSADPNVVVPGTSNGTVSAAPATDSAATSSDTSTSVLDSATDSNNIVIMPDPNVLSSATDSSASAADSSSLDGMQILPSDSENSTDSQNGGNYANDGPSGDYYSWDEAMNIMQNYSDSNGIGGFDYYSGTDGVEMLFAGNDGVIYRVDLQTGNVSAY